MMTKREAVRAILDGTGADRIPVIMNAFSLPVMQYGYTMPEVLMSPEKMTECMVGTRDWDMMDFVQEHTVESQL